MKIKLFFLVSVLVLAFSSCEDESKELKLSSSSFTVSELGGTQVVTISSPDIWTASSSATWCSQDKITGKDGDVLTLSIPTNEETSERTAWVEVSSAGKRKSIQITQSGTQNYTLSVIFNVIYENQDNATQYVPEDRLTDILAEVNAYYKSNQMGVTFSLSRIKYSHYVSCPISCMSLMNSTYTSDYFKWVEDPNEYINIFVYNFTESGILGVSHMPFTPKAYALSGLNVVNQTQISFSQLGYSYCVSINSSYINEGKNSYSPNDASVTLAHELGHYLGLHHVFAENDEDRSMLDDCIDTDYCEDTPSYSRPAYQNWLSSLTGSYNLQQLSVRTSDFTSTNPMDMDDAYSSTNLMDYAYSFANEFSANQRERVHHVLNYSPLIPGPKMTSKELRNILPEGERLDIPFRVICNQKARTPEVTVSSAHK